MFNYTFHVDKEQQVMPATYSKFVVLPFTSLSPPYVPPLTWFVSQIDARRRAKQIEQIAADDGVRKRVTE